MPYDNFNWIHFISVFHRIPFSKRLFRHQIQKVSKTNADKFGAQKLMARPVLVVSDAEVQILKLQNAEDFFKFSDN